MGYVHSIARSDSFKINNIDSWKEGLKDYLGGEGEQEINYMYSDVKRRSRNAEIIISSESYSSCLFKRKRYEDNPKRFYIDYDDTLDLEKFIQDHLLEGEKCIIYHTEYEHAGDMDIYVYEITKDSVKTLTITDKYRGGI